MLARTAAFRRNLTAATSIEYALIASLIAVALLAGAKAVGTNLNSKFSAISSKVANPS